MDLKEIEKLVASYLEQSLAGQEKEHPKFDFKKQWYDLTTSSGVSEFIKDTSSIANTFGLDGFIVIGYDEGTRSFHLACFRDSKLKDTSEIVNLVNKKVDRLFDIITYDAVVLEHRLSIIHIPPSIDKPHVVRLHQTFDKDGKLKKEEESRVFVRKNTRVYTATKYDFELMYYDRKNIIPEYQLHANCDASNMSFNWYHDERLQLTMYVTIENAGRRPVAISRINLFVEFGEADGERIDLVSEPKFTATSLIVRNGDMWNGRIEFFSQHAIRFPDQQFRNMKQSYYNQERRKMRYSPLEVQLANGTKIFSDLKILS